jgi:hypothetical protein
MLLGGNRSPTLISSILVFVQLFCRRRPSAGSTTVSAAAAAAAAAAEMTGAHREHFARTELDSHPKTSYV